MKTYLEKIDRKTSGIRCDVTPLFSNFNDLNTLVDDLIFQMKSIQIDCVACIDALGFILGTAIAMKLGVGVLPIRKAGKLPVTTESRIFVDYTGLTKSLEIRKDILQPGMKVLVVDEWIETGAQITATIELIESQKAIVTGIATINIDDNEQTRTIQEKYKVVNVCENGEG